MNPALQTLLEHPAFWGGGKEREALPTGFEALDRLLPGGPPGRESASFGW
jgi:hypothetical protein